ncbi:hypothetical protein O0I10_010048 [Lichtheimia ornata]|uniref:Cytochrome p450 n=1 Tax=Lichtheimia ornata TaxID=688661 RepID=A0AAD7UWG6_9FUNG|nr:uncharacterized protein O0I10_010048 [Lichtheimia ornata]KAJ8654226.1 hypothetical protein O0I10_010048 [Lichtheimia ornata]
MDFNKIIDTVGSAVNANKEQLKPIVGIAAATSVALYTAYALRKSKSSVPNGLKEVPTVPEGSVPYFGHLLAMGELPALKITEWHKKYGPIIRVNFGVQSWVMISDPYIAHELFSTKGSVTSGRPWQLYSHQYYAPGQRGVAFPNPGKRWKKTRTAALEVLAPKNVERLSDVMTQEADYIVKYLLSASLANGSVDLVKPLQFSSMNVIMQASLGMRAESPRDPLFRDMIHVIDRGMKFAGPAEDMSSFLPILSVMDVLYRKKSRLNNYIEKERTPLLKRLIKESLDSGKECLAKWLYEYKDDEDIDDYTILVTLNDIIGGGADTTAVTLAWFMSILCHHPDVQERLRAEIDAFISTHKRYPTFSERDNFPYLISVQKECIRFRPTTHFGVLHQATDDVETRGYYIPKGTVMASNMYAMHQNPDAFSDPEKFIPERFMNNIKTMSSSANSGIDNRDQYNFGWGRRICPGIYLAESEMFYVLTRLFAKAVIKPKLDDQGKPLYPTLEGARDAGLVMQPPMCDIRLVERTDAIPI